MGLIVVIWASDSVKPFYLRLFSAVTDHLCVPATRTRSRASNQMDFPAPVSPVIAMNPSLIQDQLFDNGKILIRLCSTSTYEQMVPAEYFV